MARSTDSPYVRAYLRGTARLATLALVLAVLFAGLGIWTLAGAVDQSMRTYEPVQVTATEEHTEKQTMGSRRTKRIEDVRVVTVTLPDGSTGTVVSEDIAVGGDATVYQDSKTGRLHEEKPDTSSFWGWAGPALAILAGAGAAAIGVSNLRKRSSVAGTDLAAAPAVALQVTGVRPDKVGNKPALKITATVLASADAHLAQGDVVELTAVARQAPGQIAPLLDGRLVKSAELGGIVAVHALQTAEPWWIGEMVNTTAQQRVLDGAKA